MALQAPSPNGPFYKYPLWCQKQHRRSGNEQLTPKFCLGFVIGKQKASAKWKHRKFEKISQLK